MEKRNIKAAFFDVDGTLLSHRTFSIPSGTRKALAALTMKGIKVFMCTGRHIRELDQLPVDGLHFDGYITLNGHLCLDQDFNVIFGLPFPEDTTRKMIESFTSCKLPLVVVEESGLKLNFVNSAVEKAQKEISTAIPEIAEYDGKLIYQITTFASRDEDELIHSITPENCRALRWNDWGVDIILNDGGKAAGIAQVLERENISPDECIAFGDEENDIDMLRYCGIGVAMGNGSDKVKEVADHVTGDVDDNGIMDALIYYGIIRKEDVA